MLVFLRVRPEANKGGPRHMRISCEPADSRAEAVGGLLHTVYTTCFLRTIGFPCRMPSPSRRRVTSSARGQTRWRLQYASPTCREPV